MAFTYLLKKNKKNKNRFKSCTTARLFLAVFCLGVCMLFILWTVKFACFRIEPKVANVGEKEALIRCIMKHSLKAGHKVGNNLLLEKYIFLEFILLETRLFLVKRSRGCVMRVRSSK